MYKLLLTGSSGFVGSNLYDLLHQDFELYGLDITKTGKVPAERVFAWDNLKELPEADVIIHLAGKAHDTFNTSAEEEYFEVNLGLTQKIFDHFLQSKARKFIFFSSVKAVADSVDGVLTEHNNPNPLTSYGKSKLAAEKYLGSKVIPANKSVYILRPCMIHGPNNKGNLNLLFNLVKKGIPWPLGSFNNLRSFVSISNLGYVVRRLIEEPIPGGTFQVADDTPLSTNTLVGLIAESLHKKPMIWNLPKWFIIALASTGDVLKLPLNSERLKKLTESYVVSNIRLKTALSIERMPVTSEEGLWKTINSFSDK